MHIFGRRKARRDEAARERDMAQMARLMGRCKVQVGGLGGHECGAQVIEVNVDRVEVGPPQGAIGQRYRPGDERHECEVGHVRVVRHEEAYR